MGAGSSGPLKDPFILRKAFVSLSLKKRKSHRRIDKGGAFPPRLSYGSGHEPFGFYFFPRFILVNSGKSRGAKAS